MPSKSSYGPLCDIRHNIDLAREFVAGLSYEKFWSDKRTVYAVTRCHEIKSEASRKLAKDLKKRHADIPWTDIAGAGNVYRHDYEDVPDQIVWHTARGLEPLRAVVEQELRSLTK